MILEKLYPKDKILISNSYKLRKTIIAYIRIADTDFMMPVMQHTHCTQSTVGPFLSY